MSGVDEVVEHDKRILSGSHYKCVVAVAQPRLAEHELVVKERAAGIGRAREMPDVLPIDGEGNVGGSDGVRDRVREDVEYIHSGAGEGYSYRYRGLSGEEGGLMPGLAVDLGEV